MFISEKSERHLILQRSIFPVLPSHLAAMIAHLANDQLRGLTEIRLRVNRPLLLVIGNKDIMLSPKGNIFTSQGEVYLCSREDIQVTLQLMSKNSLYAFEEEVKQGFLTIQGGHRVGLAGQAILGNKEIQSLKNISSLNIRIAREIKGCGHKVFPYLIEEGRGFLSTLIISPPCCGKTTLLRDVIRLISTGNSTFSGRQIGVVDERSEIGACKNGVPTMDLGPRTDILDGCPKAKGMLMLIRSMSPSVIATDELGRAEDLYAVQEALHAGVSVLATAHGRSRQEILHRPYVGELIQQSYFQRYIIITDKPKIGTIETVSASGENEILWTASSL